MTLTIPPRTEYLTLARLALAGIAGAASVDQSTLADLKLAVTEACGNAVRHAAPAGAGFVRVQYRVEAGEAIEIRVEDDGPGMPGSAPGATGPIELPESGLGLAIIEALVDVVEICRGPEGRGTTVWMRRRLPGAAAAQGR